MIFRGRMSYLWGPYMVYNCFGVYSCCMIHSNLTFEFDLSFGSLFYFLVMSYFRGRGRVPLL